MSASRMISNGRGMRFTRRLLRATVAGLVLTAAACTGEVGVHSRPAGDPSPPPVADVSEASMVDLRTGSMHVLPESILGGTIYFTSPDQSMFAYNPCCD